MKKFKVISEAEDSYHLQHENGKKFTVEKKGLNPKAHEAIKKMCGGGVAGYDEGGLVDAFKKGMPGIFGDNKKKPSSDQGQDSSQSKPTGSNAGSDTGAKKLGQSWQAAGYADGGEVDEGPDEPAQGPAQESVAAAPSSGGVNQPFGSEYGKMLQQREAAVQNYKSQLQEASNARNKVYDQTVAQLPQPMDMQKMRTPEEIQAELGVKDDQLMKSLQDQQKNFDPNRYWNSKTTGQKIMAEIGIALSGAGAGRGGTNLAYQNIKDAIGNDIEHQKSDYTNAMNLYKMNHQRFGDELQASLATRNQLLNVTQLQIAKAAGQANDAKEQFAATQALGQIQQEKAQNNRAMSLIGQIKGAGANTADPHQVANVLIQDPQQRKAAHEEIDKNINVEKARSLVMQNFNDLASKAAGGKFSPADRKSAVQATTLQVANLMHMRPSQIEPIVEENFPGAGLTGLEAESTVENKRHRLNMLLDNQKNDMPSLRGVSGLGPEHFSSTSSSPMAKLSTQEARMAQIAKANPNHPASIKFFQKYGTGF